MAMGQSCILITVAVTPGRKMAQNSTCASRLAKSLALLPCVVTVCLSCVKGV